MIVQKASLRPKQYIRLHLKKPPEIFKTFDDPFSILILTRLSQNSFMIMFHYYTNFLKIKKKYPHHPGILMNRLIEY